MFLKVHYSYLLGFVLGQKTIVSELAIRRTFGMRRPAVVLLRTFVVLIIEMSKKFWGCSSC